MRITARSYGERAPMRVYGQWQNDDQGRRVLGLLAILGRRRAGSAVALAAACLLQSAWSLFEIGVALAGCAPAVPMFAMEFLLDAGWLWFGASLLPPTAAWRTGRILRKGRSMPRPSTTSVTFGRPISPSEGENATRFAARIEREVAALADEATSDWYSARIRAHAGTSPGLTGPESGRWRRAWALGDRSRRARRRRRWPDI